MAGGGGCTMMDAVDVTYDLTGTTFEIRNTPLNGAGDQINTLEMPYTANDKYGPGEMIIRFAADGSGDPIAGSAHIVKYEVDTNFTVSAGATVETDLLVRALPEGCSAAIGTFDGSKVAWNNPGFTNYTSTGTVLCTGALCAFANLPNGMPVAINESGPQALNDFTFTNGVGAFTSPEVQVPNDDDGDTFLTLKGTETSRAAACSCN